MPTTAEWQAMLSDCDGPYCVTAHSYRGIKFPSYSAPVVLGCDDGYDYVVKPIRSPDKQRAICNDQVIGHIAAKMAAPVPPIAIVNVPQALIDGEPSLAGISAGPAHGSRYMPNVSKIKGGVGQENVPANRKRFAVLAAMYGLAQVDVDIQFFYEDGTNFVWSFDHGHFFPGGPNWTITTLETESSAPALELGIVQAANLTLEEQRLGLKSLNPIVVQSIAHAVNSPDESWGLTVDERIALAEHLDGRRIALSAQGN